MSTTPTDTATAELTAAVIASEHCERCDAKVTEGCRFGGPAIARVTTYVHAVRLDAYRARRAH